MQAEPDSGQAIVNRHPLITRRRQIYHNPREAARCLRRRGKIN
jgi:hypothetical protein